jgi:plastocyanin
MIVSRSLAAVGLVLLTAALSACGAGVVAPPATPAPAPTAAALPPTAKPAPPTSVPKPTAAPTKQPAPATPEAAGNVVVIKLNAFSPAKLEVPVGTTVVWTNYDTVAHTVTGGAPPSFGDPFGSDFLRRDQSFSYTFDKPGEYPYYCAPHETMLGVVKVVAR